MFLGMPAVSLPMEQTVGGQDAEIAKGPAKEEKRGTSLFGTLLLQVAEEGTADLPPGEADFLSDEETSPSPEQPSVILGLPVVVSESDVLPGRTGTSGTPQIAGNVSDVGAVHTPVRELGQATDAETKGTIVNRSTGRAPNPRETTGLQATIDVGESDVSAAIETLRGTQVSILNTRQLTLRREPLRQWSIQDSPLPEGTELATNPVQNSEAEVEPPGAHSVQAEGEAEEVTPPKLVVDIDRQESLLVHNLSSAETEPVDTEMSVSARTVASEARLSQMNASEIRSGVDMRRVGDPQRSHRGDAPSMHRYLDGKATAAEYARPIFGRAEATADEPQARMLKISSQDAEMSTFVEGDNNALRSGGRVASLELLAHSDEIARETAWNASTVAEDGTGTHEVASQWLLDEHLESAAENEADAELTTGAERLSPSSSSVEKGVRAGSPGVEIGLESARMSEGQQLKFASEYDDIQNEGSPRGKVAGQGDERVVRHGATSHDETRSKGGSAEGEAVVHEGASHESTSQVESETFVAALRERSAERTGAISGAFRTQPGRYTATLHPDSLGEVIRTVSLEGGDRAEAVRVELHPRELGRLLVRVAVENGSVSAQIVAESETIRQAIESALPQLRQSLQEGGLSVGNLDVFVGTDAGGFGRPDDALREPPRSVLGRHTVEVDQGYESAQAVHGSARDATTLINVLA